MYEGKSIGFLNEVTTGRKIHSVEFYWGLADTEMEKLTLYGLILCLVLNLPLNWRLSLASVAAFLMVVEGILRIHSLYADPPHANEALLWDYDSVLGWKMVPNQEGEFSSKRNGFQAMVKTNSRGLRDDEYSYEKPQGVRRILLLGDSVTVGMEVDKKEVIDFQLEGLLNRSRESGIIWEVINAGVRGYGTDQSYLFLRNEGYKYSPDLIAYIFVDNDRTENITIHKPGRKYGKSYFTPEESGKLTLRGVPVPREFEPSGMWVMSDKAAERYYNFKEGIPDRETLNTPPSTLQSLRANLAQFQISKWLCSRIYQNNQLENLLTRAYIISPNPERMSKPDSVRIYENLVLTRLINSMKDCASSLNAKFMVYEASNGNGSMPSVPTDLCKICEGFGIPYLNSFKEFFEISKGQPVFCFPNDGHWNVTGHHLATQSIYRFLAERNWVAHERLPKGKASQGALGHDFRGTYS
jgi:hypothetical protein